METNYLSTLLPFEMPLTLLRIGSSAVQRLPAKGCGENGGGVE